MQWGIVFGAVLAYMSWAFFVARKARRLDIVDAAWGGAFIVAATVSLLIGPKGWLQFVTTGLVVLWGLRLSLHILSRLRRTKEDRRYVEMRRRWKGNEALNAYVRIFLVQAVLAMAISVAVVAVNFSAAVHIPVWIVAGIAVWVAGFLFEAIGDRQLKKHLLDPENKGKLMTSGLWRYTRHPNYFGEAVQWWGIYFIALGADCAWWTIISPLIITNLLLFVTGIPLTERYFEDKPGWKSYKRRTSAFFPLPPRK